MAFGEKVRQYIFRYIRELGIGCGIWIILIGVSLFIMEINSGIKISTSIGCILLGISLITMNLLEWKPLLMLPALWLRLDLHCGYSFSSPEMRLLNARRLCSRRLWKQRQSPMEC